DCAHFLDHVDLVSAAVSENDVEFGLFFCSSSRGSATSSSNSDRSSSRNAPLLFQKLGQLSGFQNGQGRKVFNDLCEISHFCTSYYNGSNCCQQEMALSRPVLPGVRADNADAMARRITGKYCKTLSRSLDHSNQLCAQFVERRERSKRLDAIGVKRRCTHCTAEDNELVVSLGEFDGYFRSGDRIVCVSNDRLTRKQ